MRVASLMTLPNLDTAWIDQLRRITLRRPEQPGDECLHLLRLSLGDRAHDVMVVTHEDVEPLVDARRVLKLFVRMTGAERRDGRVERRRVTHAGVLVARGKRAG